MNSGEMNSAWGKAVDNRVTSQRVGLYDNTAGPQDAITFRVLSFRVPALRLWLAMNQREHKARNEKRITSNERCLADDPSPDEN